MRIRDHDKHDGDDDVLGAHPSDYTNMSDDAAAITICLRCLTAATLRCAKAIEASNRLAGARGPE